MANRDVALGLCGVVVGVLLGAGTILYTEQSTASVSAGTDVAYVNIDHSDRANHPNSRAAQEKVEGAEVVAPEAGRFERVREAVGAMVHRSAPVSGVCADLQTLLNVVKSSERQYGDLVQLVVRIKSVVCGG